MAAAVAVGMWLFLPNRLDSNVSASSPWPVLAQAVHGPLAGTAACAGRACHGAIEPAPRADRLALDEYTRWVTQDPHTHGYATLLSARSRAMARRLDLGEAHEAERCLACHTTPEAARPPRDDSAMLIAAERRYGVGCESCHGNATRWLAAHTATAWQELTAEQKQQHGMVAVRDPAALARQCAGCHVGAPPMDGIAPGRDVDHDLIAAGHPRLTFEFSSYFANLPAHWKPHEAREVRRWAIGQTVSAEAALELLRHRAATQDRPWPEFAEYDCFRCHHALTDPGWREERRGQLGVVAWSTWYFAMPRMLAANELPDTSALAAMLSRVHPSRGPVAKLAVAAVVEMRALERKLARWPDTPEFARTKMDELLASKRLEQTASWDESEQLYLALQALNQVAKAPRYQRALDALIEARAFPIGWEGPLSLPPAGFRPHAFLSALQEAVKQ
jgi:hypothetical protein